MCGTTCRTDAPAIAYLPTDPGRPDYRGYDSVGIAVHTITGDVATLWTAGRLRALSRQVGCRAGSAFGSIGVEQPTEATARKQINGDVIVTAQLRTAG